MDTAHLMAVGRVESSWVLGPSTPARLLELKELVSTCRGPGTLVLVTHALTVRPLIGILVLKPMPGSEPGAHVVGRIAAPQ
jgi:hypothetical protein